jgi:hypothetical protein
MGGPADENKFAYPMDPIVGGLRILEIGMPRELPQGIEKERKEHIWVNRFRGLRFGQRWKRLWDGGRLPGRLEQGRWEKWVRERQEFLDLCRASGAMLAYMFPAKSGVPPLWADYSIRRVSHGLRHVVYGRTHATCRKLQGVNRIFVLSQDLQDLLDGRIDGTGRNLQRMNSVVLLLRCTTA